MSTQPDPWDEAVDIPPECFCGNTLLWWRDGTDTARCAVCDPPVKPLKRLAKTYLRRNTYGQDVSDVVEMATGLKGLMRQAGHADRSYILET